jgi:carbon storage regulator
MLVVSRKKEQRIVINENIVITIVEVRGDKVRIGIDAPAHIAVDREEIWLLKQAEKAQKESDSE